jgi:hypothetical protein
MALVVYADDTQARYRHGKCRYMGQFRTWGGHYSLVTLYLPLCSNVTAGTYLAGWYRAIPAAIRIYLVVSRWQTTSIFTIRGRAALSMR